MQRCQLWAGLLLCGLLAGCGNGPQEERQADDETTRPTPVNTDATKKPPADLSNLPPAPVPNHDLYAKNFINKPAPEFVVEEWLTKEPNREGKMVMIDFWATWCGPCIKGIPKLNQFHRDYEDRLVIIGVSNESAETVRNHPGAKINYALAIDPKRRMSSEFQIEAIPNVVLIDPTGIVRWQGNGHLLTAGLLDEMLDTYVP